MFSSTLFPKTNIWPPIFSCPSCSALLLERLMRSTNSLEYETHAVKFFLMLACHYALNHTGIVTFDCINTKQTGFLLKWSITQGTHWNRAMSYSWPHMSEHYLISWELQHCHIPKKNIEGSLQCCWLACQIHPVLGFDFSLIYYGVIPFCSARAYVSVNWIYLASFQHKKDINMMTEVAVTSHCFYRLEKFQQHSISNEFCIYVNSFLK